MLNNKIICPSVKLSHFVIIAALMNPPSPSEYGLLEGGGPLDDDRRIRTGAPQVSWGGKEFGGEVF